MAIAFENYLVSRFPPGLYVGRLIWRIILQFCLIAALVEGIFLAERFIQILERVIDQPVSLSYLFSLLAWTAPEIHMALPIAILAAVYRVALRCREHSEFIVLAAAGQSAFQFVKIALMVGIVAQIGSFLISGVLYPYSKFAFRSTGFQLAHEALRGGSTGGQFFNFPGYTIYVWPHRQRTAEPPIFMKEVLEDTKYRIVNADHARLIQGEDQAYRGLLLNGVLATELPEPATRVSAAAAPQIVSAKTSACDDCGPRARTIQAKSIFQQITQDSPSRFEQRGIAPEEWTSLELLGIAPPPSGRTIGKSETAEIVSRIARNLLCLLAPFVGWFALIFTNRSTQALAMPLACAAVLCMDIGAATLADLLAPIGVGLSSLILVTVTAGLLLIMVQQILARQQALAQPGLGRS